MSLRILIANEGLDDPGGVQTYLSAIGPALRTRGHAVALLHYNPRTPTARPPAETTFGVRELGLDAAMARAAEWQPDVCFSHNMHPLDVDAAVMRRWPVVKMMHCYFGTCISGQKAWLWPQPAPCSKRFDAACLGYYLPRRCGQASVSTMWRQYGWAKRQQSMFEGYAAVVVASEHMRDEYERHGAPPDRLHCLPLFAPPLSPRPSAAPGGEHHVLFLGRMTELKGGDLFVEAIARLRREGLRVTATMAGDGPARTKWQALAIRRGVDVRFPGWVDQDARAELLARAAAIVVPSVWPEPFGLVGLEAAAFGVPAVAFDVGGVREWLRDGRNGLLAGETPDADRLAAALATLLSDPRLREQLAGGARETARRLTIDRHLDTLVETILAPASRQVVVA